MQPPSATAGLGHETYRVFGQTLATSFPLANVLASGHGPVDLVFSCTDQPPSEVDDAAFEPFYQSPERTGSGEAVCSLARFPGARLVEWERLGFPQVADFYYLGPARIHARRLAGGNDAEIEQCLLGPVLSYWLEQRGILALHASAVEVGGEAIAFLAAGGTGKTSLAAAFLAEGDALVTDDVLALQPAARGFLALPGYPQLKLWPDLARQLFGERSALPRVLPGVEKLRAPVGAGFGRFCHQTLPLTALYLLERRPEDAGRDGRVVPVASRDALIELVRHSFSPRLAEATQLQERRLTQFARLLREVPVRRLLVPSALELLPRVAEAVRRDLSLPRGNPSPRE